VCRGVGIANSEIGHQGFDTTLGSVSSRVGNDSKNPGLLREA
jgi:hypothetical protein